MERSGGYRVITTIIPITRPDSRSRRVACSRLREHGLTIEHLKAWRRGRRHATQRNGFYEDSTISSSPKPSSHFGLDRMPRMFKAVRNIVIVVAILAAGYAGYISLFPSFPHSVVVHNRSGQPLSNVRIEVRDYEGKPVGNQLAGTLVDGESATVGHKLKTAQMSVSFTLGGKKYEHDEPYLDFSVGATQTFEIQPDGAVKVAGAAP